MTIEIEPLTGNGGAVVRGLDLRRPLGPEALVALERALVAHHLVAIGGEGLTPAQQAAFTRQLGPPSAVPFIRPIEDEPDVIVVARTAAEPPGFDPDGAWHADLTFLPEPPAFSVLQAVEVPAAGGDTIWANQHRALDALSVGMRGLLGRLQGVHSATHSFSPVNQASFDALEMADVITGPEAFDRVVHPLVIAHPSTGRPALFANPEYTVGIAGLEDREAAPLLAFLAAHSTRAEFTLRWRWSPGDIVVWDNRVLQHMVVPDFAGSARRMLRTTVRGERLQPADLGARANAEVLS